MADRTIRIIIDPSGAARGSRVVNRNLSQIERRTQATSSALGFLKRAILALGLVAGARQLVRYADTFTLVENRLKLVTSGMEELTAVQEELFKISQDTRSSFESTAELFARVARSSKVLGLSQQELLDVTESVNQAVQISGATGAEASAGLIQFAQGLASGALRGDELRSVLEQLPRLAEAIAVGMGITIGQLRELGAEGKLTARDVIAAIQSQAPELAREFSQVRITVGGALTQLNNSMVRFVGELDKATGASAALASAITFVAENFDIAAKAVGALAVGLATAFGARLIGLIRTAGIAIRTLGLAIAANPIGLLVTGIGAAVAALTLFRNEIRPIPGSVATLGDFITLAFRRIKAAGEVLVDLFSGDLSRAAGIFGESFRTAAETVIEILDFLVDRAKAVANNFINTFRAIGTAAGALTNLLGGFQVGDLQQQIQEIFAEDVVGNFATVGVQAIREIGGAVVSEAEAIARERQRGGGPGVDLTRRPEGAGEQQIELTKKQATALERLRDALDPVGAAQRELTEGLQLLNVALAAGAISTAEFEELNKRLVLSLQDQLDPLTALTKEIERERELLILTDAEREAELALREASIAITDQQKEALRGQLIELERMRESLELQRDLLEEIRGPQKDYADETAALTELLAQGAISQDQFNQSIRESRLAFLESQTDVESGFERGLLRAREQFEDFASLSEQVVVDAFQGIEDALLKFTETGKLDFKSLTDSILQDLQRIAIRQAIIAPLLKALGGIGGGAGGGEGGLGAGNLLGLGSSLFSLFSGGLQRGGLADRPTLAGEGQRTEAVIPLPDNRSVPVDLRGAGEQVINLRIVNQVTPQDVPDELGPEAEQQVLNIINNSALDGDVMTQTIRKTSRR